MRGFFYLCSGVTNIFFAYPNRSLGTRKGNANLRFGNQLKKCFTISAGFAGAPGGNT